MCNDDDDDGGGCQVDADAVGFGVCLSVGVVVERWIWPCSWRLPSRWEHSGARWQRSTEGSGTGFCRGIVGKFEAEFTCSKNSLRIKTSQDLDGDPKHEHQCHVFLVNLEWCYLDLVFCMEMWKELIVTKLI